MALTAQQKVAIRGHLLVPYAGIPFSGNTAGLRTILTVGQLEAYMNFLQLEEECQLTGYPFGAVQIYGYPANGNTVTATINSTPVTYTVQPSDLLALQPLANIANNLATKINMSNVGVQAATGSISTGDTAPAALPSFGQVSIVSPTTFTLTASATGGVSVNVPPGANGQSYPQPNLTNVAGVPTLYGYIAICDYLQARIVQEDAFLSFETADVVKFRKYSVNKRIELYDYWRGRMGIALSVGPNPAGTQGMGSGFGIVA